MEWLGLLAIAIVLMYSSYPRKVKQLERKVKQLKSKGESKMSKILEELVGENCVFKLETNELIQTEGKILSVDDDWMKLSIKSSKKDKSDTVKVIRVDSILEINVAEK